MTRTDRPLQAAQRRGSTDRFEHVPSYTDTQERKARLIYCKSHVAIHPTQLRRDNISGLLGLVEVDKEVPRVPESSGSNSTSGKEVLVVWVPDELFMRMSEEDQRNYKRVEDRPKGAAAEEEGFVFVSLPAPRGEKYAFSIPVSDLYSLLVYPPSLQHWYGSVTFNLAGGVSLPTLFFHDDQTPLVTTPRSSDPPTPPWGFPPFLAVLRQHATVIRSRLVMNGSGEELWLVNPSKADREVHEAGYEESKRTGDSTPVSYPPQAPHLQYPSLQAMNQSSPKDSLLVGLSNVTNIARHAAQNVLNHPLAKPVVPHLPPAFRTLVNAPGEWESALRPKLGSERSPDVATEFEAARLYLARWARVVAEEGERSRRSELAAQAGQAGQSEDDLTDLGVFSLVSRSKQPAPKPTRDPHRPITVSDWQAFIAGDMDEEFVRGEIFRRGFSEDPFQSQARRQGWEVLLGVVPWNVGDSSGDSDKRGAVRERVLREKRSEYYKLLTGWQDRARKGDTPPDWREEWHRIDVDCRRTDRNHELYAVEPDYLGNEEKEAGGAGTTLWGEGNDKEEEGGHAALNPHVSALRRILMTYHVHAPDLGYVQGMSDLLSPIYFVADANEADAFWGLCGVMRMMESNFLRDQSGMRKQLSTLQQLIQLMDPELYEHLEKTGSLNLFFCFRWILISFKREFSFENVVKLWEALWTNFYSNNFVLFVALAVLQSHRDVIMRYLSEFDEVLKYANDLSGTIDLDTTLAQAEVLFLSFKQVVEEIDRESAESSSQLRQRRKNQSSKRTVPPELRELLVCWKPEDSEQAALAASIDALKIDTGDLIDL